MAAKANLARRRTLFALGSALVAGRTAAQHASIPMPACVLTAEQTEGPYFIENQLLRADLRGDADAPPRQGVPLRLTLRLHEVNGNGCKALAGAIVHVWHCDAAGVYSGVDDAGTRFLRGYQISDASGAVRFTTIYPGWYPGRTVHIHFKLRTRDAAGQPFELTSQLYFDDRITGLVMKQPPYARHGRRKTGNRADGLYRDGGQGLMLSLRQDGDGYAGDFDIGVRLA